MLRVDSKAFGDMLAMWLAPLQLLSVWLEGAIMKGRIKLLGQAWLRVRSKVFSNLLVLALGVDQPVQSVGSL
jgi:hypothetical protein